MSGHGLPNDKFHRLKAAFRDLVERAGGLERAAEKSGFSKSTLQRHTSHDHSEVPPINVVLLLEADTGFPFVTKAMAAMQGLEVSTPAAVAPPTSLLQHWAELNVQFTEMAAGMAFAMSDGTVTLAEARAIDAHAATLASKIESLRQQLAGHPGQALKVVS